MAVQTWSVACGCAFGMQGLGRFCWCNFMACTLSSARPTISLAIILTQGLAVPAGSQECMSCRFRPSGFRYGSAISESVATKPVFASKPIKCRQLINGLTDSGQMSKAPWKVHPTLSIHSEQASVSSRKQTYRDTQLWSKWLSWGGR